MMHPDTELKWISDSVGLGVFASRLIPKGTIVYIVDPLEVVVRANSLLLQHASLQRHIEKYSYIDQYGRRILSWDHAKYVNHSCTPNSMSTGYGFEIAIRDIHKGEEVTDEYGLLNIEKPMPCSCNSANCRKSITRDNPDELISTWDECVRQALQAMPEVDQPLEVLLPEKLKYRLDRFVQTQKSYRSVKNLLLKPINTSKYKRALNKPLRAPFDALG